MEYIANSQSESHYYSPSLATDVLRALDAKAVIDALSRVDETWQLRSQKKNETKIILLPGDEMASN